MKKRTYNHVPKYSDLIKYKIRDLEKKNKKPGKSYCPTGQIQMYWCRFRMCNLQQLIGRIYTNRYPQVL